VHIEPIPDSAVIVAVGFSELQEEKKSMSQKQTGRYCAHCQKNVMATGTTPNHLLHFFLTLFTFGLWIIVWILVSVGKIGGYRCTQCGSSV
jgi:hypothetical protein